MCEAGECGGVVGSVGRGFMGNGDVMGKVDGEVFVTDSQTAG